MMMMLMMMRKIIIIITYYQFIYLTLFGSGTENEPKDASVEDAGPDSDSEVDK